MLITDFGDMDEAREGRSEIKAEAKQAGKPSNDPHFLSIGSIKLQIEPIVDTVNKIVSKSTEIITFTFNKIMTIITLVCNSTMSK
jgi:hypothetical protein